MDKKLKDSLSKIKLLICDIDGVLTDGSFTKSTSGEELRSFNALDGVGFVVLRLLDLNVKTAWITGRESITTTQRAEELQIDDVYNGVIRKIDAYIELKFQEIYNFEHTPHPIEFDMYYSCLTIV